MKKYMITLIVQRIATDKHKHPEQTEVGFTQQYKDFIKDDPFMFIDSKDSLVEVLMVPIKDEA